MAAISEHNYEKILYDRSTGALKVHGILAIIFGGLGVIGGILFNLLVAVGTFADEAYVESDSGIGLVLMSAMIFVFWTLPHLYLIASGIYLVRRPTPGLSKTLVIINLVVGVFYNLVIVVVAIVNLTQSGDYERSYDRLNK